MSLFARLMGSTATTPGVEAAAPPAPGASSGDAAPGQITEQQIETGLQAARAEGVSEGEQAGAATERARTSTVFASDEGKANMTMAAWMLSANPTASADSIIAQLKTLPAQASTAPPAAGAVTRPLADTPKIDLTGGKPGHLASNGGADTVDSVKLWDELQGVGASTASVTTGGMVRRKTGN